MSLSNPAVPWSFVAVVNLMCSVRFTTPKFGRDIVHFRAFSSVTALAARAFKDSLTFRDVLLAPIPILNLARLSITFPDIASILSGMLASHRLDC